ncbi:MAG: NADP-dependent oxidoreductase [Rikenellaceae bacterium]|nr:NADP-dependent oxidoreductase [Rikenellaceae bacterium]
MKAIRLIQHGGPENLRYEDVSWPQIGESQLLIRVHAASVNHLEIKKASQEEGHPMSVPLPWVPGYDFAGQIEDTGGCATDLKKGDRVYGNCDGGSYAQYLAADLSKVVRMPENLSWEEAATVPHVGETAWQVIHTHGQLQPGERVLIHGAAGAVGAFAVQFARLIGAQIYASVLAADADYVRNLGADVVIDYKTTDFTTVARDMDLVVVLVSGDTQERSFGVLKQGGRLVSTTTPIRQELADRYGVTGIQMVIQQSGRDLQQISQLIGSGEVKTDVQVVYPLREAAKAWRQMEGDPALPKIFRGKIVLTIADDPIEGSM